MVIITPRTLSSSQMLPFLWYSIKKSNIFIMLFLKSCSMLSTMRQAVEMMYCSFHLIPFGLGETHLQCEIKRCFPFEVSQATIKIDLMVYSLSFRKLKGSNSLFFFCGLQEYFFKFSAMAFSSEIKSLVSSAFMSTKSRVKQIMILLRFEINKNRQNISITITLSLISFVYFPLPD